jgi:hypothetical protein
LYKGVEIVASGSMKHLINKIDEKYNMSGSDKF